MNSNPQPPEPTELRAQLLACLAVPRWVDAVLARGPFTTADQLTEAAQAAFPLTAEDLELALADHPAIGDRHTGSGRSAQFSNAEQGPTRDEDAAALDQIARLNAVYQERFGQVFLVRAAGRSKAEILDILRARLELSPEEAAAAQIDALTDITRLRVDTIAKELFA